MQENQKDELLLKSDPRELLLKYQSVFELIIRRYSRFGYYPYHDCSEVLQHLNVRLYSKINTIITRFDGRVLVRTYLSAICRNFIREYVRSIRKRNMLQGSYLVMEPSCYLPYQNAEIMIREECERFDKVMFLMGEKREKLWLLMRLIYRIKVSERELLVFNPAAFNRISQVDFYILNNSTRLKDKDIYAGILPVFQTPGNEPTHPDTLRKWFNQRIKEVILLMNGSPARSAYTEDTLQILVEKYCAMQESGSYNPLLFDSAQQTVHGDIKKKKKKRSKRGVPVYLKQKT
jgi:DNA-directed RNA polymerase specialized sigma24 family protein